MKSLKLCKDCHWSAIDPDSGGADRDRYICGFPRNINLVTGEAIEGWKKRAFLQRRDGYVGCRMRGTCGKEGRWFQAREGRG
jgi:hypothetical protein